MLISGPHMSSATQFLHIRKLFRFKRGGRIPELTLAYETWGKLNRAKCNAVMILTGISPSAHAASSARDGSEGSGNCRAPRARSPCCRVLGNP